MTHFKQVALAHASRLINHGPTVLVTSMHGKAVSYTHLTLPTKA